MEGFNAPDVGAARCLTMSRRKDGRISALGSLQVTAACRIRIRVYLIVNLFA